MIREVNTKSLLDSATAKYKSIFIKLHPIYNFNKNSDVDEMRHYWAASFFLPVGSILILTVVVLLMVLFKRCPYTTAAIVIVMLTMIIILITLSFNNTNNPVYI